MKKSKHHILVAACALLFFIGTPAHAAVVNGPSFATTTVSNAVCNVAGTQRGSTQVTSAAQCANYCATAFSSPTPTCCTLQYDNEFDIRAPLPYAIETKTCTAYNAPVSGATTTPKAADPVIKTAFSSPYNTAHDYSQLKFMATTPGQSLRAHMLANGFGTSDLSKIASGEFGFFFDVDTPFTDELQTNTKICDIIRPYATTTGRGTSSTYSADGNNKMVYWDGTEWEKQNGDQFGTPSNQRLASMGCTSVWQKERRWDAILLDYNSSEVRVGLVLDPENLNVPGTVDIKWDGPNGSACTIKDLKTGATILGPLDPASVEIKTVVDHPVTQSTSYQITCVKGGVTASGYVDVLAANQLNVSCTGAPASGAIGERVQWISEVTGGLRPYTYSWTSPGMTGDNAISATTPHTSKTYTTFGDKSARLTVTTASSTAPGPVTESYASVRPFEDGMCAPGTPVSSGSVTLPSNFSVNSGKIYANALCDAQSSPGQCCDMTVVHSTNSTQTTFNYRVYQPVDTVANNKVCPNLPNSTCEFYAGIKTSGAPVLVYGATSPYTAKSVTVDCATAIGTSPAHGFPLVNSVDGTTLACPGGFANGCGIRANLGANIDASALTPTLYSGSTATPGPIKFSGYVKNSGNTKFTPTFANKFTIDIANDGTGAFGTHDVELNVPYVVPGDNLYLDDGLRCSGTQIGPTISDVGQLEAEQQCYANMTNGQCCEAKSTFIRDGEGEYVSDWTFNLRIKNGTTIPVDGTCNPLLYICRAGVRTSGTPTPELYPTDTQQILSTNWTSVLGTHKVCFVVNTNNVLVESSGNSTNNKSDPCALITIGTNPISISNFSASIGTRALTVPGSNFARKSTASTPLNINWTCAGTGVTCTISGPGIIPVTTGPGAGGAPVPGTVSVPITGAGTYTIRAQSGNFRDSRTFNVRIAPTFFNI